MELANFDQIKSKGKPISEIKQEVYADPDIKCFLEVNKIPEELADLYFSKLHEYYQNKKGNGATKPRLIIDGGYISIVHEYQDNDEARRLKDGVSTARVFDDTFSNLKDIGFKDLKRDQHNSNIILAFERLVDKYQYPNDLSGVWLHGNFGVGKTYMLGAVANELNRKGAGVTLRNLSSVMDAVYESFNYKDGTTQKIEQELKQSEILIIDDIGAEHVTNYSVNFLLPILQHRFENKLLTLFSSNLSMFEYLKMLEATVDRKLDAGRLLERIRGLAKEVHLNGENKRFRA